MALDIYDLPSIASSEYHHLFSFDEDDGTYWFLWPLVQQLWSRTKRAIDLSDTAVFGGTDLDALAQTIEDAIRSTQTQPAIWDVVVGRTTGVNSSDVSVPVSKPTLLILLEQLQITVSETRKKDHYIIFLGD